MASAFLEGALILCIGACNDHPQFAPTDREMIATFAANRSEFDFWKNELNRPEQNCFIVQEGHNLTFNAEPCQIRDRARLFAFMKKAGIDEIDSRSEGRNRSGDGPVQFGAYSHGTAISGQSKQYEYDPEYRGPLEANLDEFSWGKEKDGRTNRSGYWHRKIEDHWYIIYEAG